MKCHRSQNKKFLVSGNGICCTVSVEVGCQLKVNQKSGDFKFSLFVFYQTSYFPCLYITVILYPFLKLNILPKQYAKNNVYRPFQV